MKSDIQEFEDFFNSTPWNLNLFCENGRQAFWMGVDQCRKALPGPGQNLSAKQFLKQFKNKFYLESEMDKSPSTYFKDYFKSGVRQYYFISKE